MYQLSICAVVKNEVPYIEEWLCFHILQGVEHFFLYDNLSEDNLKDVIQPYIDKGYVTLRTVRQNPCQFVSYNDAIVRYRAKTKWMAFLDCDEFLLTTEAVALTEALKRYENFAAVAVHWILFGPNGHRHKTDELVITRFNMRSKEVNQHMKSICQLKYTIKVGKNPHYFLVWGKVVDEHLNIMPKEYALMPGGTADTLRVHHYHTKSYEEYVERKKKPDPGLGIVRSPEWVEISYNAHDVNEETDLYAALWTEKVLDKIKEFRCQ